MSTMKSVLQHIRATRKASASSSRDRQSGVEVARLAVKKKSILPFLLAGGTLGMFFALNPQQAIAEGTRELTTDSTGYRAWYNSPVGGNLYQGINQRLIVNVYVQSGETINVGSSGIGLNGATIQLKAPNGTTYTATGSGSVGVINNRTQENAGPLPNAGGYTPYTRTVLAAETGVWQITFISPGTGAGKTLQNSASWTRSADQGTSNALLAWDVTVRNSGGTTLPGRAYITNIGADLQNFYPNIFRSTLYILTDEGYLYRVNTNTLAPFIFNFFSNNKGFTNGGNPTYLSLNANPTVGVNVQDPYAPDSGSNSTNKMFLNVPAPDLPSIATYAGGGSTWLLNSPTAPTVANFSYIPNGAGGGTFAFSSNVDGSFSIEMDIDNNGSFIDPVDRRIQGLSLSGTNSVVWDGKNGQGQTVNNLIGFPVRISTRSGEIHFPVTDAESNPSGFIITRLNGGSADNTILYWNDTSITKPGATSNLAGADSTNGAHSWGSTSGSQTSEFGNEVGIDTWTFVRSNFVYLPVSLSGTVFDDADGSKIQDGTEVGTNASGLNAVLVDSSNKVVSTTTIAANGTYSFSNVLTDATYTVLITTATATVGSAPPAVILPPNWIGTGENLSGTADATVDGKVSVTVGKIKVTGINFGIEQPPTTNNVAATPQTDPGGTIAVQVPTLSGIDPEDGNLGSGKSFRIVTLPTNGILYYNGIAVTAGQVINNYDPTKLTIDPNDGVSTVSFTYVAIDAAGKESATPATATLPFLIPMPNFILVKRITAINGGTTTKNGDNLALYKDDPTNPYDDNTLDNPPPNPPDTDKWVNLNSFLVGGTKGGDVQPNDEIEYTIYFLSAGNSSANNVLFCDRVPDNVTFAPTAFNGFASKAAGGLANSDRGIQWFYNGQMQSLTNVNDSDAAQYFSPGNDPTAVYPTVNCGGANTNGAVVVNLGNLPNATAPGTPTNSYGFVRFRGRVK